jgi:hypothetical protein
MQPAQHYIINFPTGGSGRFLAHILWCMLQKSDIPMGQNDVNSAHDQQPYTISWDMPDKLREGFNLQTPMAYDLFKFRQFKKGVNAGILTCHSFPEWDTIRSNENFKDTKFILVNIHQHEILETIFNSKIKNELDECRAGRNFREHFYQQYVKWFGFVTREELVNKITIDHLKFMIKKDYQLVMDHVIPNKIRHGLGSIFEYINLSYEAIPEDFKEKTLIVNYTDIVSHGVDEQLIALDQIASFTNITPSDFIKQQWNNYITNRQIFLDKYDYDLVKEYVFK